MKYIKYSIRSKISYTDLLYAVIIAAVFQPISFNRIPILKILYNIARVTSFVVVVKLYFNDKKRISHFVFGQAVFWIIWLVLTVLYSFDIKDILQLITKAVLCMTTTMLYEVMIQKNVNKTIDIFCFVFSLYTYINLGLRVIVPDLFVLRQTYLLGAKNAAACFMILYLLFQMLKEIHRYKKIGARCVLASFLVAITGSLLESETTRNIGLLALILVLFKMVYKRQYLKYIYPIILQLGLFFVVVLYRLQNVLIKNMGIYSNFSSRDLFTFTGRTFIWDEALKLFKKRPFVGYGIYKAGSEHIRIWGARVYAHNEIMELLVDGGVCLLIIYILLFFMPAGKIKKYSDSNIAFALILSLLLYTLDAVFEAPIFIYTQVIFLILAVADSVPVILEPVKK